MPVSIQSYECCPVVAGWCLMLCHTQCNHSQTWNKQWHGTASRVCLCPIPISSEWPLGWGWEPPCTVSSAHWCAMLTCYTYVCNIHLILEPKHRWVRTGGGGRGWGWTPGVGGSIPTLSSPTFRGFWTKQKPRLFSKEMPMMRSSETYTHTFFFSKMRYVFRYIR